MSRIHTILNKIFPFELLRVEIEGYGFNYSLKKYMLTMLTILGVCIGVSIFFGLPYFCIMGLTILCLVCIPNIIRSQFKYVYEQRNFQDVTEYCLQMIYSFQRTPLIKVALEDAERITQNKMKKVIRKAIDHIEWGDSEEIRKDALHFIEEEYDCQRLRSLHKLLLSVDKSGAKYSSFLNVLSIDFDNWIRRTYLFQRDMSRLKVDATLAIFASFILSSVSIFLKKACDCDITKDNTYIVVTTAFMACIILFYTYIHSMIKASWLTQETKKEIVFEDYKTALFFNPKKQLIRYIPIYMTAILAFFYLYYKGKTYQCIIPLCMIGFYIAFPFIKKKTAKKNTVTEIMSSFPEWLREVALGLQNDNLRESIRLSYDECPIVLKESVFQLKEEVSDDPSAVEPYYRFLEEFNIIELNSAIRMLYSLSEKDKTDAGDAINDVMQRNYDLVDKSDQDRNENKTGGLNFLALFPMMLANFKLLVDLMIFVTLFFERPPTI